jgi:hypothetical protein
MHTRGGGGREIEHSGATTDDGPDREPSHQRARSPKAEPIAAERLHVGALKVATGVSIATSPTGGGSRVLSSVWRLPL